jgi:hypothetical protein
MTSDRICEKGFWRVVVSLHIGVFGSTAFDYGDFEMSS